jgi:hypothetical protein
MLDRLFNSAPKWQSPKAQKRIEALAALDPAQEHDLQVLLRLAREDSEAAVRREAVRHLGDPEVLTQIQRRDLEDSVREAATARLHELLAGQVPSPLTLAQRLAHIEGISNPQTLLHLVGAASEPEIRLAAIARLNDESALHDIALHSPVARLRQAAAERIVTPALLETLADASRQKDKSVYRIVRERLDNLALAEKQRNVRREKIETLCLAMENHARSAFTPLYAAKTESLRQQWQEFGDGTDTALAERFETALALADRHIAEVVAAEQQAADAAQAREEMQACVETLEATLKEYRGQEDFDIPALAALLKTQRLRWELATQLQPPAAALLARHDAATHKLLQLESLLLQWQQDRPFVAGTAELLATASAAEVAQTRQSLDDMAATWQAQGLPLPALLQDMVRATAPATEAAAKNHSGPAASARDDSARIRLHELLDRLAAGIETGNSRDAARLLRKAQEFAREHHLHDARLGTLAERVRELKSWAGFAVQPKKEALIADMQALAGRDMDPDDKADAIHALQEAWKALGVAEPAIEQPLWQAFKAAGDVAFEPCRAHFAAQRELRAQNLEKRMALCAQLEQYRNSLPGNIDWKNHETILHAARREWQQYHPSDRQKTAAVQERFNNVLHVLEELLRTVQKEREMAKRALVARVQALAQSGDLRAACDTAKQLQQEWKTVGAAAAKTDQKLWREFRAACDVVFARREAEFKARRQTQEQAVTEAMALLDAYEQLTVDAGSEAARLEQAFAALTLPRDQAAALNGRLQAARRQLQQSRQAKTAAAQQQARDARLADWRQRASAAGEMRTEQAETLLLDLEILLELPSPPECQESRRERQLQLLQSRGLRSRPGPDTAASLLAGFMAATPLPAERLPQFAARLQAILEKTGA